MMETRDDLTSLDGHLESPEIISVPSCSSSLSSLASVSQDNPETMMSLLLQIQQFHTAETQKLKEKVNKWKTKCAKLAEVANNNADAAKRYFDHNKLLVVKITNLKHRLKALQSQSLFEGIQPETSKQAHQPVKETPGADLSNEPGIQDKGLVNKVLQNEAQSKKSSRPPSKLTSKKSRKKVRYSEIPPKEMLQKQPAEMTAHHNPEMATIRLDHQNWKNVKVSGTPQVARILAPDTCPSPKIQSPSGKMNPSCGATPSGHDKTNPSTSGPEPWIKKTGRTFTIPETLGMGASDVTALEDMCCEDLYAPAYESTPVWEKPKVSSSSESSNKFPKNVYTQDLSMKQLFPETPVGQKHLVTSIPRSESQFPVDLYNTQVKSPTFCGESVMTTPGIADGSSQHGSKITVRENKPTPLRGDNSDMYALNETCESEESILLLDQREKASAGKAGVSEGASRSKSDQEIQREQNTTSRDMKETATSAEVQNEATPAKDCQMTNFKKRRYNSEDSSNSMCEETVLPDAADLGKENSPEGLDDLNSLPAPNLISGVKHKQKEVKHPEKIAATSGKEIKHKSLKQSKLSKSMCKPDANRPLSLMQKYNGGNTACIHEDSQLDTDSNRAIELSLVEQKGSVNGGQKSTNKAGFKRRRVDAAASQSQDASVGFKIPSVPHQKKQMGLGSPTPCTENREHLTHSFEFTSTPQDLNGSIDPLMDLTRLESDGALSPDEMDLSRQTEHPRSARQDSPGQEADFGTRIEDEENDSCVDLFEEDEDEGDYEDEEAAEGDFDEEMDRSEDGHGVTGYINSFDKVPEKIDQPNYKYTEVVRKRDERQKLKGFGCKECDHFYGNLQLTNAEREVRMKACSRHRALFSPSNTPDHYWSIGFPDTQTCIQRGYINEGGSPDRRVRKKNKYKKRILGKEVEGDGKEITG